MLTIIGQGDANQNHSEVPPHTHWGGEEVEKLEPPTVLVGLRNDAATLEESLAVSQNIKQYYHMLKARQRAQNGVAHTKPHITKLKLNYSFSFPRNGILNLSIRNQH